MSNFSNLSRQIVPYNITGLQDINVNTINGTTPFNGVIANTFYPLSFNTSTGILSQTPVDQDLDQAASVRFNTVNTNSLYNDTGGDLTIDNPYGIISIGGSLSIGGNIIIYNVITNNKVVIAAENTIDYSLRLPLIRNTVASAPLIVGLPTISGYQTIDYNDQAIKTSSNVQFNSIKCNLLMAQSAFFNSVKIGGAGGTSGLPLTGYNYVRVTTTSTTSGGGGFAFMTGNDGYRGNVGADGGYIYITADASSGQGIYLAASHVCRLSSSNDVVEFYVGGSRRGTVSTTLMDMLIPITSSGKITGSILESSRYIITGAGLGACNLQTPNIATSYYLTMPTGLPSINNAALISSTTGVLSYNDQALLTTSTVTFNRVNTPTINSSATLAITAGASNNINLTCGASQLTISNTNISSGSSAVKFSNIEISTAAGITAMTLLEGTNYGVFRFNCNNSTYYQMNVSGTQFYIYNSGASAGVYLNYGGTNWIGVSDITLKTNIEPIKPCLDLINQLKPVSYNWKRGANENKNYGFIAQDMEQVIPELVDICIDQPTQEKVKAIKTTDGLIPYLVKSIQELSKELNDIKEILKRNNIKY